MPVVNVMNGVDRAEINFADSCITERAAEFNNNQLKAPKSHVAVAPNHLGLRDLIALTILQNREVAVCQQGQQLILVSGSAVKQDDIGAGGSVAPPAGTKMLIHVHPATHSHKSHFEGDKRVNKAGKCGVEAVVDLNGDVFVYDDGELHSVPDNTYDGARHLWIKGINHDHKAWPKFLDATNPEDIRIKLAESGNEKGASESVSSSSSSSSWASASSASLQPPSSSEISNETSWDQYLGD